jgi:hypothetical protein
MQDTKAQYWRHFSRCRLIGVSEPSVGLSNLGRYGPIIGRWFVLTLVKCATAFDQTALYDSR